MDATTLFETVVLVRMEQKMHPIMAVNGKFERLENLRTHLLSYPVHGCQPGVSRPHPTTTAKRFET